LRLATRAPGSNAKTVQAKLNISKPGDPYEQEADRVAEQVMRMPEPGVLLQRKCGCGGSTASGASCEACSHGHALVQRSATVPVSAAAGAPPAVHDALRSSGQPLDHSTRAFMEARFGHGFDGVRVHTGPQSATSAQEIGARAFTVGSNIVFGQGEFSPGTSDGRRLLAHELAHVVQQGGGRCFIQRDVKEKTPCAVHAYDGSNPKDSAIVPKDGSGVAVSSVADLVTKVNAHVDDPKNNCSCVHRLDINGHGTDGYQSVGNGSNYANDDKALVHDSKEEHLKQLDKIKFCSMGVFMLIGCHVGRGAGKTLLSRLSAILPGKLIGGAQHYTAPTAAGGPRVAGAGDVLGPGLTLPRDKSDPYLQSRFVRWHLTIEGKEFVINGDETTSTEGKAKLKAADRIKVKTPEGLVKIK
jgi:hypothetical protein